MTLECLEGCKPRDLNGIMRLLGLCALEEEGEKMRLSHVQFRRERSYNDCSVGQSRLPSLIRATATDFSGRRALGAGGWFSHKARDVLQHGLSATNTAIEAALQQESD